MFLYHGTSAAAVPHILKEGIKPRQESGLLPNHDLIYNQGDPNCVYMSKGYASFFAAAAAGFVDEELAAAAMFEIDTDLLIEDLLVPDEEFIAPRTSYIWENDELSFQDIIVRSRIFMTACREAWKNSLLSTGTCAYMGIIPPAAIKRVSYIDFQKMNFAMQNDILDISVSEEAFRIAACKYKMIDAWFFGGKVEYGYGLISKEQHRQSAEYIKEFEKMWQDRSMVKIEICPRYKNGRAL